MNEIIKKITKNKVYGHAMAACIILLVLSSVNSITKGDWNGIFNNIIWLTVACLNFKITSYNSVLNDIIDCQERFIDRICNAIEVAKTGVGSMEDYELDEICENNRDCGNDCLNCPHYAKYMEGKCDD